MKKLISEKGPAAIGPYSAGYMHGGFLFLSGQVGVDPTTGIVPERIEEQARQACLNVGTLLNEAGTGFGKVIKTTCFLADMGDFAAFNAVYAEYFVSKPARSCVAVKSLPNGVLCEIEAIAITD